MIAVAISNETLYVVAAIVVIIAGALIILGRR